MLFQGESNYIPVTIYLVTTPMSTCVSASAIAGKVWMSVALPDPGSAASAASVLYSSSSHGTAQARHFTECLSILLPEINQISVETGMRESHNQPYNIDNNVRVLFRNIVCGFTIIIIIVSIRTVFQHPLPRRSLSRIARSERKL